MELEIKESDIPNLDGKRAIITGGSSGIGLAAAKILSSEGVKVFILDINCPDEDLTAGIEYKKCDISQWLDLNTVFSQIGVAHIAIANAGVSEDGSYLKDTYDEKGNLLEPNYKVIDVNMRGTFNFVKLAVNSMKRNQISGSIVMTASATAYAPEQSLPVYSATKLALINFMRAMRSNLRDTGITINAVAPAATITKLLPRDLAAPIITAGLPVSTAEFVGLAVVFSAVATESQKVDVYGKDTEEWKQSPGRWNGRTILTLGDRSTEVEGSYAHSRQGWFGVENLRDTKMQQAATDFRATKE